MAYQRPTTNSNGSRPRGPIAGGVKASVAFTLRQCRKAGGTQGAAERRCSKGRPRPCAMALAGISASYTRAAGLRPVERRAEAMPPTAPAQSAANGRIAKSASACCRCCCRALALVVGTCDMRADGELRQSDRADQPTRPTGSSGRWFRPAGSARTSPGLLDRSRGLVHTRT